MGRACCPGSLPVGFPTPGRRIPGATRRRSDTSGRGGSGRAFRPGYPSPGGFPDPTVSVVFGESRLYTGRSTDAAAVPMVGTAALGEPMETNTNTNTNARAMAQDEFTFAAWVVLLRGALNATGADLRDAIRNASDADAAALVAYCASPARGGYSAVAVEAAALIFLCSGGDE